MARGFKDSKGKFHPTGNNGRRSSREKSIDIRSVDPETGVIEGMTLAEQREAEIQMSNRVREAFMKGEEQSISVNEDFVDNVSDWVNNDEPMYKQMLAWATNYKRKQKRGVFNEEKALNGMEILADQEIKMYKDNVGKETFEEINKGSRVARQDKEALKVQLLERVLRAIDEGEV